MSVKHNTVTVTTTATSLTAAVPDTSGNNYEVARSLVLTNTSSADVFVGGSGVTTTNYGIKVPAGTQLALDLARGDEVFAIVASGTADCRCLHTGV